jgi:transcriptional regulator with XRE-family HTH domain
MSSVAPNERIARAAGVRPWPAKKAPNPIDKHVGSRVRMRRLMLGMSQEKLGDALGRTFQQVQKYEKGTNRIAASRLAQIARILQVAVSFFFDGAPGFAAELPLDGATAPSPAYVWDFLATRDGLALAAAFNTISPRFSRRRSMAVGERLYCGRPVGAVTVLTMEADRAARTTAELALRLDLRNHSPTGFAWGYGGSGPAQLALALLADALGDDARALRLHQHFKSRVVVTMPERWSITRSRILAHVAILEDRAALGRTA